MLLRVKIKNFTSFYDEVEFNMFPNLKRKTFKNHIYSDYRVPLLKQSAIYGANGSGKSNFLGALRVIKQFASKRDFYEKFPFEKNKFLLAGEKNDLPSSFLMEFENEGVYFIYIFEINDDLVVREELYESGLGKVGNILIFSRTRKTVTTSGKSMSEIEKIRETLIANNPSSSLLSLNQEFPIIDDRRVKIAFSWFEKMKIISLNAVNLGIIQTVEKDKKFSIFVNEILAEIDLGLENVVVEKVKLDDLLKDHKKLRDIINANDDARIYGEDKKILYQLGSEGEHKFVKRLLFEHKGIDGYRGRLEYTCQSDGTAATLNLLPAIYAIKNNDCLYCIDEIDNSIHPKLILALLNFFSSMQTKGQLIYTTHQTILLGNESELRPDEIWLTEKRDGNTNMYSLNDFKLHHTLNIENGYLDGRFGASPRLGNLSEEIEP